MNCNQSMKEKGLKSLFDNNECGMQNIQNNDGNKKEDNKTIIINTHQNDIQ